MKRLIIILIILTLISGCVPKFSDIKEKIYGQSAVSGKKEFIGGTKGVVSEIVNPAENGKAYLNHPLNIAVKLTNEGEAKAEGKTCIFGSYLACDCQNFVLEGKRRLEGESLEGEEEILTFNSGNIESGAEENYFITAKTRYDYKTYGIIKSCVKKDPYSEKGCEIRPDKNIIQSASSAPVGITEVKQELIPEGDETASMRFTITVKNSGKEDIYSLDEDKSQCETPFDMKRTINVKLINAPGRSICNPAEIREGKDEATTSCIVTNIQLLEESYEQEITVELEYAYETIDSNKFEVV